MLKSNHDPCFTALASARLKTLSSNPLELLTPNQGKEEK